MAEVVDSRPIRRTVDTDSQAIHGGCLRQTGREGKQI